MGAVIFLAVLAVVLIAIYLKLKNEESKMEGLESAILQAHKTGNLSIIRNYCDSEGIAASVMQETRYRIIQQLADSGDLAAMNEMVLLVDTPAERQEWHRKCAEAGDVEAMYAVALSYLDCSANESQGVERDDKKAFYWFERAAENGHESAKEQVVSSYYFGDGVAEDKDKAFAIAKDFYERGNSECGLFLAMHFYGNISDKRYDVDVAIHTLERIIGRGEEKQFADAAAQLGYIYGGAYMYNLPRDKYSDRQKAAYCFVLAYVINESQIMAENANKVGYNFTEFEYRKWFEDAKNLRYNPL